MFFHIILMHAISKFWTSLVYLLWLVHTARNRDQEWDQKKMGFYILYRNVHTDLKLGNEPDPLSSIMPVPFPVPVPVPVPLPCSVNEPLWAFGILGDTRLCSEMFRLRSMRLFVNVDGPYLCDQDMEKHHFSLSDTWDLGYFITEKEKNYFLLCSPRTKDYTPQLSKEYCWKTIAVMAIYVVIVATAK